MRSKNVSIGFSERKQHKLKNRLLPVVVILSYLVPFLLLLFIDITQGFRFLVPVVLLILAVEILGETFRVWYKYIHFFGFPSLQACRKMLELDQKRASFTDPHKAKGGIWDVVIATFLFSFVFIFIWGWTGWAIFLYPAVYLLCISIKAPIRRARPPAVLLAAGSILL